jgi:murein DD-endopeptidase MepM/ murein hydrolase activator NlpD
MDRITLLVIPDERSPVRRVQIPRALVRHGPWVALVVALVAGLVFADWMRLRIAAVDVAGLRAKGEQDQAQLAEFAQEMRDLEGKMQELAEFERKVRVIADLPARVTETGVPARIGAAPRSGEGGQGGDAEDDDEVGTAPDVSAPGAPIAVAIALPALPAQHGIGIDAEALRRIREKAARLAERVDARRSALEELMAALRGVRERLAATPSIWPTNGFVTSHFGWRISPFTGHRQFHSGLDIAADGGTEIVAAAHGRVVFTGPKGPLGQVVIIEHGHGFRTVYGHLSAAEVKAGQEVDRGQRIAKVGSTGRSTGPHLHYAVILHGRSVDPSTYVLD